MNDNEYLQYLQSTKFSNMQESKVNHISQGIVLGTSTENGEEEKGGFEFNSGHRSHASQSLRDARQSVRRSKGIHRLLNPEILTRLPDKDRIHARMPPMISEFFFD